jgi:hypothetical protein
MKTIDYSVRMRDDLALEGYTIPAYDSIETNDEGIGDTMLTSEDLNGAIYCDICEDDTKSEYNFTRVKLKDNRIFFVHGVDLDFGVSHA